MTGAVTVDFLDSTNAKVAVKATTAGPGGLPVVLTSGGATADVNLVRVGGVLVVTGGVAGSQGVGGTSAAAATDDGSNPVKIGGVFLSTAPVYTNGQRGNFQMSAEGAIATGVYSGTSIASVRSASATATNGSGSTSSGVVSVFTTTYPTYTNGQYGMVGMTARGELNVSISSAATTAGVYSPTADGIGPFAGLSTTSQGRITNGLTWDNQRDIAGAVAAGSAGTGTTATEETGRPFVNLNGAVSQSAKGSAGFLHTVTCNTPVAAATLTLYNNTAGSGAKIATITIPAAAGNPFSMTFDAAFSVGCFAVSTGTADWTITTR